MTPAHRTLRAPATHRAVAAVASPVLGVLISRLVLRLVAWPELPVTIACLVVGLALGWRAWNSRVELDDHDLRVVNTLASTRLPRRLVRRVHGSGRIEHSPSAHDDRAGRTGRTPSEALHQPWWSLGLGADDYAYNREVVRSWLRTRPEHADTSTSTP